MENESSSYYKLIATVFSGAYRFAIVNLVALFCTKEDSALFASSFFMISLLTSLSGMAVSSQSYVASRPLPLVDRQVLVLFLLIVFLVPFFYFWNGNYVSYIVVCVASLFYSQYEIVRSDLASYGRFRTIVISGIISLLLSGVLIFVLKSNLYFLTLTLFAGLILPICFFRPKYESYATVNIDIFKDVVSYSFSNGFSSGVSFLVPLLLTAEFTDDAMVIAKLFTLTNLFLFFPRYLSAGFLVSFRENKDRNLCVKFEISVLLYIVLVSFVGIYMADLFFSSALKFSVLFITILISQLALPSANVMMVFGEGFKMLRVNTICLALIIAPVCVIYCNVEPGQVRGELLLYAYLIFTIFRVLLTKITCSKMIV